MGKKKMSNWRAFRQIIPLGLLASALWAPPVRGGTVSLSPDDVESFSVQASSSLLFFNSFNAPSYGATFDGTGSGSIDVGLDGLSIGFLDGDVFVLSLANNNEHEWRFQLFVETTTGDYFESADAVFDNDGIFHTLSVSLTGGGTIQRVFLRVSNVLPTTQDNKAEFSVSAVPEPSPLLLLGALLTILGIRRQRL